LEKFVLFIPDLESQLYNKKEFRESITQLSCTVLTIPSHTIYESVGRKLYLRSVAFGTIEFQLVLLDFKCNKITFIRKMNSPGNVNRAVYEWLSSLGFNFEPKKMSFVLERPEKNYTK
jgi:hypothetical protein